MVLDSQVCVSMAGMTTTHPAAYLRRSYVDPNSPGDISREAQRAAVRKLAVADGHNGNLIEYDDWGISADVAKSAKRTAYARLLADMEAGSVSAVYAFDVDRLYRDPRDLIRLQDAATRHRVRIVTTGGPLAIGDGDDPAAEAFAFIGSVFGRLELQKAKKRNRAAREARLTRGDRFGQPPYGFRHVRDDSGRVVREPNPAQPIAPILAAYREARTALGASRLLNVRGIPSPQGGLWYAPTVTRLVQIHAPELLPRRGASGARIRAPKHPTALSQLIRCHCGAVMTPNPPRGQLYCSRAAVTPDHGRRTVQESALMPWVKAEATRFAVPADAVAMADEHDARRVELEGQRERLGWAVTDGLLTREQAAAKGAEIAAALDAIDTLDTTETVPQAIEWDAWTPEAINEVLRTYWHHVELDAGMQPIRAEWRLPAEYLRP